MRTAVPSRLTALYCNALGGNVAKVAGACQHEFNRLAGKHRLHRRIQTDALSEALGSLACTALRHPGQTGAYYVAAFARAAYRAVLRQAKRTTWERTLHVGAEQLAVHAAQHEPDPHPEMVVGRLHLNPSGLGLTDHARRAGQPTAEANARIEGP